ALRLTATHQPPALTLLLSHVERSRTVLTYPHNDRARDRLTTEQNPGRFSPRSTFRVNTTGLYPRPRVDVAPVPAVGQAGGGGVKASKQHGARRPVVEWMMLSVSGSRAGGWYGC